MRLSLWTIFLSFSFILLFFILLVTIALAIYFDEPLMVIFLWSFFSSFSFSMLCFLSPSLCYIFFLFLFRFLFLYVILSFFLFLFRFLFFYVMLSFFFRFFFRFFLSLAIYAEPLLVRCARNILMLKERVRFKCSVFRLKC